MKLIYFITFILCGNLCLSQININQFNQSFKDNPKPILIYFYTDWCGICKIQEKQIGNNPIVKQQLNKDVYYLKFDGETDQSITFFNQNYITNSTKYRKANHSFLTAFVPYQEINYPLWIILNKDLEIVGKYNGLIKPNKLEKIINQLKKDAIK